MTQSALSPDDPQAQFDRYFKGVWEVKRWRAWIGVAMDSPIKVESYRTSAVTGELYEVVGRQHNGERVVFNVNGRNDILGWRRVGLPLPPQDGSPP